MNKKVAIILGYYNGGQFINQLINSIFCQTFQNFHIFIFDDNSEIPFNIDSFNYKSNQREKITVYRRDINLGFTMNFLKGLSEVDDSYEYYSFCDQDDIWEKDKLSRGIQIIESRKSNLPSLYGSKTWIANKDCSKIIGESITVKRSLTFKNAIFQSFAGGNTMIFNLNAKKLIINKLDLINPISHDWWTYLLISGFGGNVYYDPKPSLLYRQHNNNQMGTNKSWNGRISRFFQLLKGDFKACMDCNISSLNIIKEILNDENKSVLEDFSKARKSNFIKRIYLYNKSGVYRQNLIGSFIFFILFIFNRI